MAEFVDIEEMPELKELLQELLDVTEGLTNWEMNFIETLSNWDGRFTVGQAASLKKVHEGAFYNR